MNIAKQYRKNALPSRLTAICLAVLSCAAAAPTFAATAETNEQQEVKLNEVVVKGKKKIRRKDTEITGLGKIVKHSDGLDKEQVLGIRDLTRYDPSIAVVEQGRGASSGYSIRGVDRNRISLTVDGLPQIQSYTIKGTPASSGAINEIEYENITEIEINKGANSAEQGSGALGGSLAFRTKEAKDIIKEGQNWGLNTKSAYSSKNNQFTQSIAAAGRLNGFEGMAVFTHRKGQATQTHSHAGQHSQTFSRIAGYTENPNDPNTKYGWFTVEGDCADPKNCDKVRLLSKASKANKYLKTEEVPADQYTGNKRILPNPMDYQSRSWLTNVGYHFSPRHYLGGIMENTRQRYDIQDMNFEKYWTNSNPELQLHITKSKGIYRHNEDIHDGLVTQSGSEGQWRYIGLKYSRLRYFDERHRKSRNGLLYRYTNPDHDTVFDHAQISFNRQNITLDTRRHDLNCSVYPEVDKNCRPSIDKPWSAYHSERSVYGEKHNLLHLEAEKKLSFANTSHKLYFGLGLDRFQSKLERKDIYAENAQRDVELIRGGSTKEFPDIYRIQNPKLVTFNLCSYDNVYSAYNCNARIIDGHNHYIALRDHMSLGKYVDWGIGGRYDYHKMTTDDPWTASGTFRNTSWNSGFVFKPTSHLSLLHRISSGFRVPSFQELFGDRIPGFEKGKDDDFHYVGKFKPEKALNNEVGIHLKGNFGHLEASYFRNKYKDLIGLTHIDPNVPGLKNRDTASGYRNMYNATTDGINIIGKLDWYNVFNKLPEGLYSTVAYNHVKLKKASLTKNYFQHSCTMLFDAIQPSRYVLGLGYDAPNGKWGVNGVMTYSKAKNPDELKGQCRSGITRNTSATKKVTKPWYIFDVSGYVTLKDKLTLRAGIYNLTNRRYSQWENVRQSALGAVNRQTNVGNYSRYAAPGRNVTVSMEMKF
ncbi:MULTISPECIES: lactoferrin/transferrin family TonB-dependent receptor [unclassified Neisseria]|uniref:lactoferrin/transferrin family TonB-dependent receptor n=1 Tax=unclassified Neisseria TaxID=2623750 RepID=UPI002666E1EA|nr:MULTISPECIES: lactoferrin/transferrin family TonB-dependent receptor [unclassified Neisseria]MDO1516963.1 lactoferrin/transferrin family TonB-dependent receptor [Neisseria sp. MVDL18-041461]MDO1564325.1 lactoferrin/transferrin family TonB-dependent receptor [Neisseria sp. MVDL20-010259]